MASRNSVKILEASKVAPAPDSPKSATEFCLPLTFFEVKFLLRFPPGEMLVFYKHSSPNMFHSSILPTLKCSLSQALLHFLPLAGHLTWPSNSTIPCILYVPGDAVSLTIAESNADFDRFTGKQLTIREAMESRPYIPELLIIDSMASLLALQVTLFPGKGFCVGVAHHGVLDGKSMSMFLKTWAFICMQHQKGIKTQIPPLPEELIPCFDRTAIRDSAGLETVYLKYLETLRRSLSSSDSEGKNICPRSLRLLVPRNGGLKPNMVRATFRLSPESIKRLKEKVLSCHQGLAGGRKPSKQLHLSTFVVTFSYVLVSLVRARGGDGNRKVYFTFAADCRGRFQPPIPLNYFGSCFINQDMVSEASAFMEDNGVAVIAEKISDLIKGLNDDKLFDGERERLERWRGVGPDVQKFGVSGSIRFGLYKLDFGWGRPAKVEIIYIDRASNISVMESGDGSGGVEIGLALERHEMEAFSYLFSEGLNYLPNQSKL